MNAKKNTLIGLFFILVVMLSFSFIFFNKSKVLISNTEKISKNSKGKGKCGYEYFYTTKNGSYLQLNKIEVGEVRLDGMTNEAFDKSLTKINEVTKESEEPDASITAFIYTDSCQHGTSTPTYYYKNGEDRSIVKNGYELPVEEIIKGETFEEVESIIFNNPTAKLMECSFRPWIGSAESLLNSRTISYTPVTVTGQARMLSEDQKNYVIKQGGQVAPTQEEGLYVETTVSYTDTGGYVSENDCGDAMYSRTRFYESIDIPNVFIRLEKSSELGFWNSFEIVK